MSRLSIKQSTCEDCGDAYEWTTRNAGLCKPCRKVRKYKKQAEDRRAKGQPAREMSADSLPPVDWVMERQFSGFFELMGVRYKKRADVTKVVNANGYRQMRRAN